MPKIDSHSIIRHGFQIDSCFIQTVEDTRQTKADSMMEDFLLRRHRFLMCPPTYFDIEYSINPWMDPGNRVDKELAQAQWNQARALLEERAGIELIDPVEGLPDMTFIGDAGLVFGRRFLVSNFHHRERQPESEHYADWFQQRGYEVLRLPESVAFEGLGDVVLSGTSMIVGHGPRSSPAAIGYLREHFPEFQIRAEVELVDDVFFHAGLCIALLDPDTVLFYPGACSQDSVDRLRSAFRNVIEVDEEDARDNLVCNNVPIDRAILMADCSSSLETELGEAGFQILRVGMSEFMKSGGSVRCLVLNL